MVSVVIVPPLVVMIDTALATLLVQPLWQLMVTVWAMRLVLRRSPATPAVARLAMFFHEEDVNIVIGDSFFLF